MRYVSVFSGVEAATLAFEPLGWEPVCFCEFDEFPSQVLRKRFPRVPNLGDIRDVKWKDVVREWGPVDLVVGGSPCQSFSVAGNRAGLEGESGLMWEYVRAVREIMPRWLLWENVPGALSSSHGEDFRCLLQSLDELGYGLAWRVLDAQFFGVAQRRRRVFVVGHLGDGGAERACQVLFEPESLRWDSSSSREKRAELAARAGIRAKAAGFKFSAGSSAGSTGYGEELSPTLIADYHNAAVYGLAGNIENRKPENGGNGAGWCDPDENGMYTLTATDRPAIADGYVLRRLTPLECERLQGFPDGWTDVEYKGKPAPDTLRYRAIGNSMAVPVMKWIGERIERFDQGGAR